jgi:hypothetical protein
MDKIFKYRTNIRLIVIITLAFAIFPAVFSRTDLFLNAVFYAVFAALILMIILSKIRKRIIVNFEGITVAGMFHSLNRAVTWDQIEEVSQSRGGSRESSSGMSVYDLVGFILDYRYGIPLEIYLSTGEDAILVYPGQIRNFEEFYNLVVNKTVKKTR